MRKLIGAAVLAATVLMPLFAEAQTLTLPTTTQEFLAACESRGTLEEVFCIGALAGAARTMSIFATKKSHLRKLYGVCALEGNTLGQIRQEFINHTKADPSGWQWHWSVGVVVALTKAYPCYE